MKIPIAELKEGVSLSLDVVSPNGQLLLKSGFPLTEKHLRAFKMWGITEVETEGENDVQVLPFNPEILAKADLLLHDRFYGADLSNPVLSRIYGFCLKRLAQKLSQPSAAS
ncbi:MAG: hypothetical protein V4507_09545 [Verrucomicrobiota bacterium]